MYKNEFNCINTSIIISDLSNADGGDGVVVGVDTHLHLSNAITLAQLSWVDKVCETQRIAKHCIKKGLSCLSLIS